jgi:triphosphoribosyl-dephospho-CoA synthase
MSKITTRSLAEPLALALILEASGYPKPGNVHRTRDYVDLKYEAFLATGIYALKYLEKGVKRGVHPPRRLLIGDLVYGLVRDVVDKARSSNTCLGSSLLLSLLSVSIGRMVSSGLIDLNELESIGASIIRQTTVYDAVYYYKAIRKAKPSYLKPSDETGEYVNVWDKAYIRKLLEKKHTLYYVLSYSSRFDIVADDALNGFKRGYQGERFLRGRIETHGDLNRAIVETYLYLLSENRDTIVFLKHGGEAAREASIKARRVLDEIIGLDDASWVHRVWQLDQEFYEKKINPGSIADIVAEAIGLYLLRNTIEKGTLL